MLEFSLLARAVSVVYTAHSLCIFPKVFELAVIYPRFTKEEMEDQKMKPRSLTVAQ